MMMKRLSIITLIAAQLISFGCASAFADELNNANKAIEAAKQKTKASGSPYGDQSMPNTRLTYTDSMNLEVLGRGMLWSVAFEKGVSANVSVGLGIGTVGVTSRTDQAVIVPMYMNYYFMNSGNSPFGTVGVNIVTNNNKVKGGIADQSDVEFGSSSVHPTFGLGYEFRTDGGFLFRVAGYGIAASNFKPWFGGTFGFAF